MNRFDLISKVQRHFVWEKAPFGVSPSGACVYGSMHNPEAPRCAIGICLPDGHPALDFVGSASTLKDEYPDLWQEVFGDLDPFDANVIQTCHDDAATLSKRMVYLGVDKDKADEEARNQLKKSLAQIHAVWLRQ